MYQLEAITGFETSNAYDIMGTSNGQTQPVFFAGEDSDCCERQFCGSSRSFKMGICAPGGGQPIFTIERPLRCKHTPQSPPQLDCEDCV